MTSRYGITIPFDGVTLLEHRDWFHRLADLGYTDVWSAEVDGADGFTPLTVAAIVESRLNLGVAVTPVFTRGAGLLAMSIAAMAEVSGGRFTMGLGASSEPVVQRWNGISYEEPYARTRDVLRFVKRALDGEKIDEVFETFEVHGFKLSRPVINRPPILLGALRPGMLRLAGREADGAILNWLGATDVAQCRAEVGPDKTIAARLFVIPNENADAARFIARRMISSYLTVNAYAEFHRWLGRGDALTPMWDAWAAGDRKLANEVIPDSVVDELVIHGSYEACREHVLRYVEAGVEVPTIAIVPFGINLEEAVEGLAPR
ncbi:MAG TPA: LLM class F420-dependent oxidoreductase [Acidimicrobiales bacterium]|jgi:probable F420-dependent oxidoreductase|nr:LLM class F420-dependent oxidoreductase [Acidimicrobiales bacterium]